MNARIDDLRGALHAEADDTTWPSADHTLAAVETRVRRQRRRRMAGLAASTAVALAAVGAVVVLGRPDPNATPRPAHSITSDLARVHGDKHFPEYTAGLRRLAVLEVPFATPDTPEHRLSVDPAPGADLYAVARCPQDRAGAGPQSPAMNEEARVHVGDVTVPCFAQDLFRTMAWPQHLDGAQSGLTVWAVANADPLSQSGSGSTPTVPGDAVAELAIYETVPWRAYPFDKSRRLSQATKPGASGGPDDPELTRRTVRESDGPVTFTVPRSRAGVSLTPSASTASQLRVTVDGRPLFGSLEDDPVFPSRMFGPEVRGQWLGCWEAEGCTTPTYGLTQPDKAATREFTVTARVRGSSDPDASWTLTFTRDVSQQSGG